MSHRLETEETEEPNKAVDLSAADCGDCEEEERGRGDVFLASTAGLKMTSISLTVQFFGLRSLDLNSIRIESQGRSKELRGMEQRFALDLKECSFLREGLMTEENLKGPLCCPIMGKTET